MSHADVGDWGTQRAPPSFRAKRALLAALIVIASALVVWLLVRGQAQPEVQRLPARERQELFQRTLLDLRLCATESGALIPAHCSHQASLAQTFAECDAACRELASRWENRPTR